MFFKNIHIRIKVVLVVFLLLFILIIGKVFYIQVIQYNKLNQYASGLWSRNLPIEANRGLIFDRNGVVLANNLTTTSLVLIPNQIKNKKRKRLSFLFPSISTCYSKNCDTRLNIFCQKICISSYSYCARQKNIAINSLLCSCWSNCLSIYRSNSSSNFLSIDISCFVF